MKIYKPKFWDKKKGFFSLILLPLTFLFEIIIFFRRNFIRKINFDIHIICVGNIYVGGTGKTPLSILLAKELSKRDKKLTLIRKYYKSHVDEYGLIKNNFKNVIIKNNRADAIKEAVTKQFDTAILDDGFQDYKIRKNINILCFNKNQLIGNGHTFPSGPLRENLQGLKNTEIVMINGDKDEDFESKVFSINKNIKIFYSYYKPVNINDFRGKKLVALAGIGNPENFFKIIIENKLNLVKKIAFPDHYIFNKDEILKIINDTRKNNFELITTEKDFYKIKNLNLPQIKYLKLDLVIHEKEKFLKKILDSYD
tara:strand:+ start:166 stop:1098 length:933 start_codon:yes stop_codon:yes gene_type:complete